MYNRFEMVIRPTYGYVCMYVYMYVCMYVYMRVRLLDT